MTEINFDLFKHTPKLISLFSPFLETVKEESLVTEKYYNRELANKDIVDYLLEKIGHLLSTSERARKNYVEILTTKPRRIRGSSKQNQPIYNGFFVDTYQKGEDIREIFDDELLALCFGVDADNFSNLDDTFPERTERLEGSFFYVLTDVVNFLSTAEIISSGALPNELLQLVASYAVAGENF